MRRESFDSTSSFRQRAFALSVHVYTSMGMVAALLTAICVAEGNLQGAFAAMLAAVLIDATDGALARAADVKRHTPWIDGRKLDDIVDYVNYTFLPMLLIWRGNFLPWPAWFWCAVPLVASSFAFVHNGAKEEDHGFFRGFPSYWNVVAFYVATLLADARPALIAALLLVLSLLSVAPIRFVYPNRPPCWKPFFLGGAALWGLVLLVLIAQYPRVDQRLLILSLVYPVLYAVTSFYLDWRNLQLRRQAAEVYAEQASGS